LRAPKWLEQSIAEIARLQMALAKSLMIVMKMISYWQPACGIAIHWKAGQASLLKFEMS
jgi:hypothetical protein